MEEQLIETKEVNEAREALAMRLARAQMAMEMKLQESVIDMFSNFIDPSERFFDPSDKDYWVPVGGTSGGKAQRLNLNTEADFNRMREIGRMLELENEFAQNALANRVAFTVGTGMAYKFIPRKYEGSESEEPEQAKTKKKLLASKAQKAFDEFHKRHRWGKKEREFVRREDRDGEWLLRRFNIGDGRITVRVIEPEQCFSPADKIGPNSYCDMGIQHDPIDKQEVTGYWIDGELVPADEILHQKANVDDNVRRGISSLWSVRKNFARAAKLQKNMSTVAAIQAAVAAIRKFSNTSESQARDFLDKKANLSYTPNTDQAFGSLNVSVRPQELRMDRWKEGTVLNMPLGQDLDFTAKAIDATKFIAILQSELRAIAARFVMPEFMLTSDASNANYSSTLVAEGPSHKQFQERQSDYKDVGYKVAEWVIDEQIEIGELDEDFWEWVSLSIEPPTLIVRDAKAEAESNEIKNKNGVMSIQTWCAKDGLDYEQEQSNIKAHNERFGGVTESPLPLPPENESS